MEDRIEVGEYVRTKDGRIAQIKSIDYEAGIYRFDRIIYINDFRMKEDVLYSNEMFKKVIVKHRKQPIDLVEVGDYVNESKVLAVMEDMETGELHLEMTSNYTNEEIGDCTIYDKDIQTILTKEQMMANCYKVGGEDEQNYKI